MASYSLRYRRAICCATNRRVLLNSTGSSIGVNGWLKAASRRPSQLRRVACPTSNRDLVRRWVQPDASEICPRELRVSENCDCGRWQLTQATLPVSPCFPSVPGSPLLVSSKSGPEKRVSKKNFLPSTAVRGSSRYAFVMSGGGTGNFSGDRASSCLCVSSSSPTWGPIVPLPPEPAHAPQVAASTSKEIRVW